MQTLLSNASRVLLAKHVNRHAILIRNPVIVYAPETEDIDLYIRDRSRVDTLQDLNIVPTQQEIVSPNNISCYKDGNVVIMRFFCQRDVHVIMLDQQLANKVCRINNSLF